MTHFYGPMPTIVSGVKDPVFDSKHNDGGRTVEVGHEIKMNKVA